MKLINTKKMLNLKRETWFDKIFGFDEGDFQYHHIQKGFNIHEEKKNLMKSKFKPTWFVIGDFQTPSLKTLLNIEKEKYQNTDYKFLGSIELKDVIQDVFTLIFDKDNEDSVFQVASQLNCLEMISPDKTPEDGITEYEFDKTQGPMCAMACPAATFYRNYLYNGGQTSKNQLNLFDDIENYLENSKKNYWKVKNGYCLINDETALRQLNGRLDSKTDLEELRNRFKVGVQYDIGVWDREDHKITQVFCSALPISYSEIKNEILFEKFASLILDCSYDATFTIASNLAKERKKRIKLYLTALGGGAFGNQFEWIDKAIIKNLKKHKNDPIDVYMVHFKYINPLLSIEKYKKKL